MKSRVFLLAECLFLFGLVPGILIYAQLQQGLSFFPVLFGLCGLTLFLGHKDPEVRFRQPGSWKAAKAFLPHLLLRAAIAAFALFAVTACMWPDLFLGLPRRDLRLWMLVMTLYPLLSVAPQEYIFRIYFLQRYRPLFGSGSAMLWANAIAFAWAHAFFLNWTAPLLSLVAGLLLADTWRKTGNLRAVWLEHTLYGHIVFTSGLGWFFYHGSTAALRQLTE